MAGLLHNALGYLAAKYFPLPAAPTDPEPLQLLEQIERTIDRGQRAQVRRVRESAAPPRHGRRRR